MTATKIGPREAQLRAQREALANAAPKRLSLKDIKAKSIGRVRTLKISAVRRGK